jgi:hypothetical protein
MWLLYHAQAGICAHCFEPIIHPDLAREIAEAAVGHCHGSLPSLDRVRPGSIGGTYAITNLLLAHKSCNERRGDHTGLTERTRQFHRETILPWLRVQRPDLDEDQLAPFKEAAE